jgi:hypothetical protein
MYRGRKLNLRAGAFIGRGQSLVTIFSAVGEEAVARNGADGPREEHHRDPRLHLDNWIWIGRDATPATVAVEGAKSTPLEVTIAILSGNVGHAAHETL